MRNFEKFDTRPMVEGGTFDVVDVCYAGENKVYDLNEWSPGTNPFFKAIEEGTKDNCVEAMRSTRYLDYAFSNAMKYYLGQAILKDLEQMDTGAAKEKTEMLTGLKEKKEEDKDKKRVKDQVNDKFKTQWANEDGVAKGYYREVYKVTAPANTLYVANAAQIKKGKDKFFFIQGTPIPQILGSMDKDLTGGPVEKMAMYLYCTNNSNAIKDGLRKEVEKQARREGKKPTWYATALGKKEQHRLQNDAYLAAGLISNEEHDKQEIWIETQAEAYFKGQDQKYSNDNKYSEFKNAMASKFLQELLTIEPRVCAKGFDLANEFMLQTCELALDKENLAPVARD